ncbi:MAG: transcription elongation factor GreA [Actinomycetota bacterium]|nr:transcription elongation factor GreA [Actinomycetota bacterium]
MEQPGEIVVSPETLERMHRELEELTTKGREEMSERLLRARELGDLKENAEYHSAKDAQGLMEARIRQLQHTIKNAVVREASAATDEVASGVIVTVKDGDDVSEYLLADSMEEKATGIRTITTSSPLGSALLGKKVGEEAVVHAPAGDFSVEVIALRPY